jgi:hypothetical protein
MALNGGIALGGKNILAIHTPGFFLTCDAVLNSLCYAAERACTENLSVTRDDNPEHTLITKSFTKNFSI